VTNNPLARSRLEAAMNWIKRDPIDFRSGRHVKYIETIEAAIDALLNPHATNIMVMRGKITREDYKALIDLLTKEDQ